MLRLHLKARLQLGLLRLMSLMPWPLVQPSARTLAWLAWHTNLSNKRHITATNLRLCLGTPNPDIDSPCNPAELEQLGKENFYHSMLSLFFHARLWWRKPGWLDTQVVVEGGEEFARLARQQFALGKPIFLVGYHSLYLELVSMVLTRMLGLETIATFRSQPDKVLERASIRGRLVHTTKLVASRDTVRLVREIKKRPMVTWIAVDQDTRRSKVFAPFFGQSAATSVALARIARMFDAPLVGYAIKRDGAARYVVHFFHQSALSPMVDLTAQAIAINRLVAKAIMVAPEQYLWAHRRLKTQPRGAPKPY